MHIIQLYVCKLTQDGQEIITDHKTILELAGLNPKHGFKGIALQSEGNGVVLDNKGHYGELRHGYYVAYSEEEVPVDW